MTEHNKICLRINVEQALNLEGGFIEFNNYLKQIPVSFKVFADFECILKSVKVLKVFTQKKCQDHIPCTFSYKLVCVDNKFSKSVVVYRGGNCSYRSIEAILKECVYCKEVMEKHFKKNLIMTEKEEESFLSSNICWISEKLIYRGENIEVLPLKL